jgi:hypothetical protein
MNIRTLVLVVLAIVLVYGLIEATPLLVGPTLTIDSPESGQVVPGGVLSVSGVARRAVSLTLNGAPLLADATNGRFTASLAYAPGTSILTWSARDRFGRTITKTRTIYVPN